MIQRVFTIASIPTTVTIPGTGTMPNHLVTMGGLALTANVDYSRTGRVFTFPSMAAIQRFSVKEPPDGVRRQFSTNRPFILPLASVAINGIFINPALVVFNNNHTITVNTPTPPQVGDLVELAGFGQINFRIGDVGEIREV